MGEVSRARAVSGAGVTGRTRSERILWDLLRTREPGWLAEVPTGQYRLDYFCPELRLAVEVDGASHWGERARRYDEKRDQWHLQHGIRTVRVSAREVETDPDFVIRHIDEAAGRRRLEFAIMPPSAPPVWQIPSQPTSAEAPSSYDTPRRRRRRPTTAGVQRRPRRRVGRTEPSSLALAAMVLAVFAFFGNWFGAQDAYWDLSGRAADQVSESLTEGLGPDLLIPRPVSGATVCPAAEPSCGRILPVGQAQLLADRMNLAMPAQAPPPDLRCAGKPSPVVMVAFRSSAATTVVEVLPGCGVLRSAGVVRRATPGVLKQLAQPAG